MSELVKIVEKKQIPSEVIMFCGLRDVCPASLIADSYLIFEHNPEETAHMGSSLLLSIVVLHEGFSHAPLRVYGNKKFIAVISELAVPASALHTVMHA
ncbi:MAG: hypothetical protein JSV75_03360 [Candidatus Bathyarchaeota archaeon]|nr:MAG: hypothetical protein JSV75_03360 [Candidatus Bathyarchaeota archaeon]